jgi:hypothetical protein
VGVRALELEVERELGGRAERELVVRVRVERELVVRELVVRALELEVERELGVRERVRVVRDLVV